MPRKKSESQQSKSSETTILSCKSSGAGSHLLVKDERMHQLLGIQAANLHASPPPLHLLVRPPAHTHLLVQHTEHHHQNHQHYHHSDL